MVDPGWDYERRLAGPDPRPDGRRHRPEPVTGIVVTHVHPDHHGLTARLREASGAPIAMHEAEVQTLPARIRRAGGGGGRRPRLAGPLRACRPRSSGS